MQPLGRKSIRFPSKEDMHYRNGELNWWEGNENGTKAESKRIAKKEIDNELVYILK